jgi:hypothetical protein
MKLLYHTPTATLVPYPRADDLPVLGLDADYQVLDLIQETLPEVNTATQIINPTEVIDLMAGTVTRDWQITDRVLTEWEIARDRRAAMAAAFDALPLTVQAAFYASRMTAEAAMDRGRFDIARALIEAVSVPAELEVTKAVILSHFP